MTAIPSKQQDKLCADTLRLLAVDMVEKANSGHPGLPMGAADMAYALWTRHLRHNPADPTWPDRDRFVLSAGHGSSLLYALLHLTGYNLSLDDLKAFRSWGSRTPGHPESHMTAGVEVTTGPLGQGIANAVGMAIGERYLAARFNRDNFPIVDHTTYTLVGDGDLMEGISTEAISLAGHLRLGKLICLYDSNGISLAADTRLSFTEDIAAKFVACGWQVLAVADGHDASAIDAAIVAGKAETDRPTLIVVTTHIGFGSPNRQDSCDAHGSPLGADEVGKTKLNLGWTATEPFTVPTEALEIYRASVDAGAASQSAWEKLLADYGNAYPEQKAEWDLFLGGQLPAGWDAALPTYLPGKTIATRAASGEIENAIAASVHNLIGGSADLDPSTKTNLKGKGNFQSPLMEVAGLQGAEKGGWGYHGANIAFGVREHAMGAITNGLAAHGGLLPFCSTFFVFSDYLRPSIRVAALSKLRGTYIFTHDSVAVGEDGPTHQPIEQLASLRAMPNLVILRPADATEAVEAWKIAMTRNDGPVILLMSRQNLPILDRSVLAPASGVQQGAYILADAANGRPEIILIATGAELHQAHDAWKELTASGVAARLVSMPSWERFEAQSAEYRASVLPPTVKKRISIEAGCTFGWSRYVGDSGLSIGVDHFGESAPGDEVLRRFGFTSANIVEKARQLLRG